MYGLSKLKREFDIVAPKYKDKISIFEYNVQDSDKTVKSAINQYDISLVPTIIYIDKNGKEVNRTEGYINQRDLEKCFNELLK